MYVILKKKFLCRLLSLIAGTVFFKVQCFLISREKLRSSIPKRHCIYFIMELAAIRYVYTTYLTGISIQGVFLFQRSRLLWSSFLKITVFLWNKHLQLYLSLKILSQFTIPVAAIHCMIPPWFQTCIYWNIVCYSTTSVAVIHFFYGTVIILRQHLNCFSIKRALCLFHNTYSSHPL